MATFYADTMATKLANPLTNFTSISESNWLGNVKIIEDVVTLTAAQVAAITANDIIKLFPTTPGMQIDTVSSWITTTIAGTSLIIDVGTDDVGTSTGADDADCLSDGLTITTTTGLTKMLYEGGTKAADFLARATLTGKNSSGEQAYVYATVKTATSLTETASKIRFGFLVKQVG
jgi:hypothetical protein